MSSPTAPQFCAYCGAALRPQVKFCASCGRAQLGYAGMAGTGLLIPNHLLKQRYRIQRRIGQGGMGAVYQAEDTLLNGAPRAVKEMSQSGLSPQELQEATTGFQQEAMLLAGLMHPQLPRIYDYFEEDSRWYLVMDFIVGETLETRLEHTPGGKLPLEDVLGIGIKLCSVLHYLHTRQPPIIFRDLKPANVMLTLENDLYLIDFGIARLFKPGQAKDTMLLGSPGYAAPEQYGKVQTTASADIYSLGATLHQLLSGHDPTQTPFQFPPLQRGPHPAATALAALMRRMVEMDREKRPTSMQEVKQELQRVIGQQSAGSSTLSPTTQPKPTTPQKEKPKQEFFVGEQVKHPTYGTGTIIRGSAAFSNYRGDFVQVDFGGQVGKIYLDMRKEPLEKISPAPPVVQPKPTTHHEEKPKQEFFVGEYVKHPTYGTGRVTLGTIAFQDGKSVEVDFGGQFGKKTLDLAWARLEKIPKGVQPAPAASQPQASGSGLPQKTKRQWVNAGLPRKTKQQWLNEGIAHSNVGRYMEALSAYERALQVDPNYADAWNSKGVTLENLSRYTEALAAYERALQLDPNYADAWTNKGDVLTKLRRSEEARQAHQKALQLRRKG